METYRWLLGELRRGGERKARIVKNVKEKNGGKSRGKRNAGDEGEVNSKRFNDAKSVLSDFGPDKYYAVHVFIQTGPKLKNGT